jgi:hypothetical protein
VEIGSSGISKTPSLTAAKATESICFLYRLSHLVILGEWFGNTGLEVSVMGENRGGYGCKDGLYRVKGLWAMGVRP